MPDDPESTAVVAREDGAMASPAESRYKTYAF